MVAAAGSQVGLRHLPGRNFHAQHKNASAETAHSVTSLASHVRKISARCQGAPPMGKCTTSLVLQEGSDSPWPATARNREAIETAGSDCAAPDFCPVFLPSHCSFGSTNAELPNILLTATPIQRWTILPPSKHGPALPCIPLANTHIDLLERIELLRSTCRAGDS